MSEIDYAFKAHVLNNHKDLLLQQKRASLYDYALAEYEYNGTILYALKTDRPEYKISTLDLFRYCEGHGLEKEFKECIKINHADYKRHIRLNKRVESMLTSGNCIFVTLTFNDDTLRDTTAQQRRVAVSRYLKSYNSMYVANIDFGAKNHREHYHALIRCDKLDCKSWLKYGSINFERVRIKQDATSTKLSKYISKLSNHAIKETTHRSALMYSR